MLTTEVLIVDAKGEKKMAAAAAGYVAPTKTNSSLDPRGSLEQPGRIGMIRSLTTFYPDAHWEHRPAAPHARELPPRRRHRRLPLPSPRRPRTRFLPRATRPHSPNPHLRGWTILANLPIARPSARPVAPVRMPPYPHFGFSPEPVSEVRPPFSRRLSSYRQLSFSPRPFSELPSS